MEVPDPAVEIVISLPRRSKIRTLSPDDCDELIVAAARAKSMHLAALAALQPPDDSHPYPDPAAPDTPGELAAQAELPWTSVHPFSASAAVVGKCAACGRERGDAVHEQPGETPDDDPEPYPAADGVRCGAEDGDWRCTAQRGHGGPDHLAYAAGEIRHRWPRTDKDVSLLAAGVTIATATEVTTADVLATDAPGQCTRGAVHGARGLFCWRPAGHDGWHYDSVDELAWRLTGETATAETRQP